jgi:hypothetical protein
VRSDLPVAQVRAAPTAPTVLAVLASVVSALAAGCSAHAPAALLGANASSLTLGVRSDGLAALAWTEAAGRPGLGLIAATETAPGEWRLERPAEGLPGASRDPQLACAAGCALVWAQAATGGVRIQQSILGAGGWSRPGDGDALSSPPHAFDARVAVGSDGEVLAVWNQGYDDLIGVALARTGRDGVVVRPRAAGDVLSPARLFTNDAKVVRNRAGDAVVAWYQSTGGPLGVFVSERNGAGGAFSRPGADERLSLDPTGPEGSGGRYLDEPAVAIAESGEVAVVWEQPVSAERVALFAALRDRSGAWHRPGNLDGAFADLPGAACCPRVAFSSAGDLLVAWIQRHEGRSVAMLERRSLPGGRTRSERLALSAPDAWCDSLEMATGSGGRVVAAWAERSPGAPGGRRIVACQRPGEVACTEAERWRASSVLSRAGIDAYAPAVAVGGPDDRVVVAWLEAGRVSVESIDGAD